jgi:hypothetical protein
MRWPWLTLTLLGGYVWWCLRTLFANRGMLPLRPWVDVFEPQQRALIAFLRQLHLIPPDEIDYSEGWLVSQWQLRELDEEIAQFFEKYPEVRLQPWRVAGDLQSFDRDLLAY